MSVIGEWKGTVGLVEGKSVLVDLSNRFPLSGAEFFGEDGELKVYIYSGSPGIFNGDQQNITAILKEGTHLFLTNPSATEIHPTLKIEEGIQTQRFELGKSSILEYIPEPIIPFKNTNFTSKTTVSLREGAQTILSDIITAGRVGSGEAYEYSCLNSIFEAYKDDRLMVCDNLMLSPDRILTTNGILGDYTHIGTLWVLSGKVTAEHLEHVQRVILADCQDCYAGVSLLQEDGLVIRLLGYSAQTLQQVIKLCWDYFRKELLGLQPLEVLK